MSGTLDDRYFEWLYGQIGAVRNRNPARSYWHLSRQLYTKEFVWLVANDDGRAEDGKALRYEFLHAQGIDQADPEWLDLGCSVLEVLIAISRRMAFETLDREPQEWFWELIVNLDLRDCSDAVYNKELTDRVDDTLERFIYRNYRADGHGGIFPLKAVNRDQRRVELWYQMSAYLMENVPM